VEQAGLASRAAELGLSADELEPWLAQLSDGVVAALLSALIRYEDALRELSADGAVST
jgi:hypothetical protein